MRYRAAAAATLRVVTLDELTAVYHRASGVTHVLIAPAPEILAALADDALDLPRLMARLAARFDLADASSEALQARLDELEAAGLVSRA